MIKILFIYGTRPEAIKMAPIIRKVRNGEAEIIPYVCLTGQHKEMLIQVNKFFDIKADYDLDLMTKNQSLSDITARCVVELDKICKKILPNYVFVQGDTTTAMVGALVGYYNKIEVAHIEAGLRSGNKYSPFPEEINRKIISSIADIHFAPTTSAKNNLQNEGIRDNIYITGNTVIDALRIGLEKINKNNDIKYRRKFRDICFSNKIILITGHRRENFGNIIENICQAIKEVATSRNDVEFIYPVHPNPNIHDSVYKILNGIKNIHLMAPLQYNYFIWIMAKSYFIITDSGGVQEEAPYLGKPVLIIRNNTERIESIISGTARLIGTEKDAIKNAILELMDNKDSYEKMKIPNNPYGDGKASDRIIDIIKKRENLF